MKIFLHIALTSKSGLNQNYSSEIFVNSIGFGYQEEYTYRLGRSIIKNGNLLKNKDH